MNVGKRTILYLVRKWSKTLLLFMIFLVVGTLVISGVSIRKAADQAAANVRQSLGGGFVMKEDHSDQSKYERRDQMHLRLHGKAAHPQSERQRDMWENP